MVQQPAAAGSILEPTAAAGGLKRASQQKRKRGLPSALKRERRRLRRPAAGGATFSELAARRDSSQRIMPCELVDAETRRLAGEEVLAREQEVESERARLRSAAVEVQGVFESKQRTLALAAQDARRTATTINLLAVSRAAEERAVEAARNATQARASEAAALVQLADMRDTLNEALVVVGGSSQKLRRTLGTVAGNVVLGAVRAAAQSGAEAREELALRARAACECARMMQEEDERAYSIKELPSPTVLKQLALQSRARAERMQARHAIGEQEWSARWQEICEAVGLEEGEIF